MLGLLALVECDNISDGRYVIFNDRVDPDKIFDVCKSINKQPAKLNLENQAEAANAVLKCMGNVGTVFIEKFDELVPLEKDTVTVFRVYGNNLHGPASDFKTKKHFVLCE